MALTFETSRVLGFHLGPCRQDTNAWCPLPLGWSAGIWLDVVFLRLQSSLNCFS